MRYAVKLLYSSGDVDGPGDGATIAGLKPSVFMSIACPHLGVRRFTYVPLPSLLHPLAGVFVGKTGADLFLSQNSGSGGGGGGGSGRSETGALPLSAPSPSEPPSTTAGGSSSSTGDTNGAGNGHTGGGGVDGGGGPRTSAGTARDDGRESTLLYSMGTSEEFLRPLKAFRWRRAYANRRGDFMVPYRTAAFLEPSEGDGSEAAARSDDAVGTGGAVAANGAGSAPAVGTESFTIADRLLGAKNGAIVGFSRVGPATASGPAAAASEEQGEPAQDGGGISARIRGSAASEGPKDKERKSMEEEMAAGLNSCGWEKVRGVLFVVHEAWRFRA